MTQLQASWSDVLPNLSSAWLDSLEIRVTALHYGVNVWGKGAEVASSRCPSAYRCIDYSDGSSKLRTPQYTHKTRETGLDVPGNL